MNTERLRFYILFYHKMVYIPALSVFAARLLISSEFMTKNFRKVLILYNSLNYQKLTT